MNPPRFIDVDRAQAWSLEREHAAITADGSVKLYKVATGQQLVLTRVLYLNATGLAADATNAFAVTIQNASTVAATIANTDSDDDPAGASIAANTFVEGVLSATLANRVFDAGEEVSLNFDEDGTATLPAGFVRLDGYLL